LWYAAHPIVAFTQVNLTGVNSAEPIAVADDGNGNLVIVGDGVSPFDVWTSSDGTTWARSTPTGITPGEVARSIGYDEQTGQWVLLTDAACYTSQNGIAWVQVSPTYTARAFQYRSLAFCGRLWVSVSDDECFIMYSTNGGVDWRPVRIASLAEGQSAPLGGVAYSRFRGRFMACTATGTNGTASRSLAVATNPFDVQDTLNLPTVT
jgi:hypothetical protein